MAYLLILLGKTYGSVEYIDKNEKRPIAELKKECFIETWTEATSLHRNLRHKYEPHKHSMYNKLDYHLEIVPIRDIVSKITKKKLNQILMGLIFASIDGATKTETNEK